MSDEALRSRLESIWAEVRKAIADYDVPRMKRLLQAPEGMPTPTRPQAADFLKQLPDLSTSRFLKLVQEKDRAGYVARTHVEQGGTTLTIIRFRRKGEGWELVPAPETLSSFAQETTLDDAAVADEVETQPVLKLFPPVEGTETPPPAPSEPPDERPEAVIRKELEGIWRRIREAFAAGTPEAVADVLLYADDAAPPSPAEAKDIATKMPVLARSRFVKLVWSADKPQLIGYLAEIGLGDVKATTVALIAFVRKDGAYRFVPGPGQISVVQFPQTAQSKLGAVIDADPRLSL